MMEREKSTVVLLRVVIAPGVVIGPGKAAILEGIREAGSISAAGKRLGMSYKRAWYLVETLNRHFASPLVRAERGGKTGGGASLTDLGEEVLASYREMEKRSSRAVEPVIARLRIKASGRRTGRACPDGAQ